MLNSSSRASGEDVDKNASAVGVATSCSSWSVGVRRDLCNLRRLSAVMLLADEGIAGDCLVVYECPEALDFAEESSAISASCSSSSTSACNLRCVASALRRAASASAAAWRRAASASAAARSASAAARCCAAVSAAAAASASACRI